MWAVGRLWKYGNVFLRQKFSKWQRSVSWHIIMVQHPIVCNVPLDSLDAFSKLFQDIFEEGVINRFFCNHPDSQSAVFCHHSTHHFHILIIFDEFGLLERGSPSTFSQPSLEALWHLKTTVLNTVESPSASVKEANVSVADLLSFTQNLIAYHSSIFSCITKVTR